MSSKLREALEGVESILSTWLDHLPPIIQEQAQKAIDKAEAILDEPLRNCDVGTAEEQDKRFRESCKYLNAPLSQNRTCFGCPVHDEMGKTRKTLSCDLVWAQMPYESEAK